MILDELHSDFTSPFGYLRFFHNYAPKYPRTFPLNLKIKLLIKRLSTLVAFFYVILIFFILHTCFLLLQKSLSICLHILKCYVIHLFHIIKLF